MMTGERQPRDEETIQRRSGSNHVVKTQNNNNDKIPEVGLGITFSCGESVELGTAAKFMFPPHK
jgi:hypothetical protein